MWKFCKHFTSFELERNRVDETSSGEVKFAFFTIEFTLLFLLFIQFCCWVNIFFSKLWMFNTRIRLGMRNPNENVVGGDDFDEMNFPLILPVVNLSAMQTSCSISKISINNMCNQHTTRSWLRQQEIYLR